MEKRYFVSILIGFLMFVCIGSAQAITYDNYIQAITTAADALVAAQNNDGSFDWVNDGDQTDSGSMNTQGATARGLVAAYKSTGNANYLQSANATADWLKNNSTGLYNKDIEFLFELAGAGGSDYTGFARTQATAYINTKIAQTGATTGAQAVYNRYQNAAWVAPAGVLDGLKYWMIGEWGDVARLLGDTEIYSGYTGTMMASEMGSLLNNDFATYNATINDDYFNLGLVGILEGLEAGIDSGGSYTETQNAVAALADRLNNWMDMGSWQTLGYTTYALSLFDEPGALYGADILGSWINDGHYFTGTGAYLEPMGEALLGLSAANVVPEPSTILLLGSGLAGLAWYGRKRNKV